MSADRSKIAVNNLRVQAMKILKTTSHTNGLAQSQQSEKDKVTLMTNSLTSLR